MSPRFHLFVLVLLTVCISKSSQADLPVVPPEEVGLDADHLARIDAIVQQGLMDERMPGCVVCVGRHGKIAFLKSYGHRQVEPNKIPMTNDTVFDMASITKPVATATSVMMLVEQGLVRLSDRVSKHLTDFRSHGKEAITIRDLLLHQGGLIPDNALSDYNDGYELAIERINELTLRADPGEKFIYTDVGFIVLAELVRQKTGLTVHEYSQQNLFGPLGMRETGYLPPPELQLRAATTEQREGRWMQGEVHDPRAYRLDGVAGHAGLFSTARDLAVYAQMMLNGGQYAGRRVLSRRTIDVMTDAYPVSSGIRGLGWDKQTGYSSNRSELMSPRAFGHGGFTGTVLWIDPELDLFYVFLSNRVHPNGKGYVNPMAGRIATVAVSAIRDSSSPSVGRSEPSLDVLTGIDQLQAEEFEPLAGQRVGLITNHTGIDRLGRSTVEVLHSAKNVRLVSLFSPEHGFAGQLDQAIVGDSQDARTGLKIYSLYGETRRPTPEMLSDIDTLVFDIQDIGARFYTYISTMGEAMLAAADQNIRFVVLDRPNPINGVDVAGPVLDQGRESFVGFHPIAVRHGMTVGELARMMQREREIDVDLHVVPMRNWNRADYFDRTGLLWINPSPNMRSLTEAVLYPGIGLLETTNLSVGRGTDTPFEVVGSPWIDARELARELNQARLPGVTFIPIWFRPSASKFADEDCQGVNIVITDRSRFRAVRTGLQIAVTLRRLYPDDWQVAAYDRLLGDAEVLHGVTSGENMGQIESRFVDELAEFRERRASFLLY